MLLIMETGKKKNMLWKYKIRNKICNVNKLRDIY